MTLYFHWTGSCWEIREMFGLYAHRIRGHVELVKGVEVDWWRASFCDEEETWFADIHDLFLLFDLCEMYLSGNPDYLAALTEQHP